MRVSREGERLTGPVGSRGQVPLIHLPKNLDDETIKNGNDEENGSKYFQKKVWTLKMSILSLRRKGDVSMEQLHDPQSASPRRGGLGTRLRTIHRTAVSGIRVSTSGSHTLTAAETLALDSTDYVGAFLFHGNSFSKYLFDDGYVTYTSSTPSMYFYLRDHQGNNRAVAKFATLSYENPSLSQTTYYYPYGGVFGDKGSYPDSQPYKYNGKELDRMHGLDWYDYGARQYDPAIARFTSMDPLAEKYYHISPYAYCAGNPVNYVDPDGRNPIYDTIGNFLGTDDLGLQGYYYVMDKGNFTQGMSHFEVGDYAIGKISSYVEQKINGHYCSLPNRPDYDGFVTVAEGIRWAKSHPNALKNPTPDNTLYINAAKLDFGSLSISDFPETGIATPKNLFTNRNIIESAHNPELMATVYALGVVDMILTNQSQGTVRIVNDSATDYDWNVGGGIKRDAFIRANNFIFGINPNIHGFKTFYYGIGTLRR